MVWHPRIQMTSRWFGPMRNEFLWSVLNGTKFQTEPILLESQSQLSIPNYVQDEKKYDISYHGVVAGEWFCEDPSSRLAAYHPSHLICM